MMTERVLSIQINNETHRVLAGDHRTLLEVLREDLGMTGTKHGCDLGECLAERLVLGAVASAPLRAKEAEQFITGRRLTDEVMEEAGRLATQPFRPQNNTDMSSRYRKWMIPAYVVRALRDLVVDDA